MWLLHTTSLELRCFDGPNGVSYAILSHVWEAADRKYDFQKIKATYEQYRNSKEGAMAHAPSKIYRFCSLAAQAGFEWAWIDTCCIDKTSSAEVSEAINSMYAWYRAAHICYVYLHDVPEDDNPFESRSAFRRSKYHQRGWTLQEILAQEHVVFLSALWNVLGRKDYLLTPLVECTGVDGDILLHNKAVDTASVAQRMSWAARRVTTKDEDRAYSLMGIFGVAMPVIYGEGGDRAFLRLQKEIIATCPDQTIFSWGSIHPDIDSAYDAIQSAQACGAASLAWGSDQLEQAERANRNLLAKSPSDFKHSAGIRQLDREEFLNLSGHYVNHRCTFSADGISLHLPISSYSILVDDHSRVHPGQRLVRAAALACTSSPVGSNTSITLLFLSWPPNSPHQLGDLSQELVSDGVGILAQNNKGDILLHDDGSATGLVSCSFYRGAMLRLGAVRQLPSESLQKQSSDAPLHSFGSVRNDFFRRELRVQHPAALMATYERAQLVVIDSSSSAKSGFLYGSSHVIEIPNWVYNRLRNSYGFLDSSSLLAYQARHHTFHVAEPIWSNRFYKLFVNAGRTNTLGIAIDAPCEDKRCTDSLPLGIGRLQVFFAPGVVHHHDTDRLESCLITDEVLPDLDSNNQTKCGRAHFETGSVSHFKFPIGSGDEATEWTVHIWLHPWRRIFKLKEYQEKIQQIITVSIDFEGFEKR